VSYTYVGQDFSYGTPPSFQVTALNALSPATITVNYTGDWGMLDASSIDLVAPSTDTTQDGTTGVRMVLDYVQNIDGFRDTNNTTNQPSAVGGIFDATFTYDDFTYAKNGASQISPFTPSVDLIITNVIDSDSITSVSLTLTPTSSDPDPIRYGRMQMYNAHGSELEPLVMDYRLEYYDSNNNWALHDDGDSYIQLTDIASSPISITAISTGPTAPDGKFNITLSAPGVGSDGAYVITTDVSTSGEPWLQYDWDGDGTNENPSATATLGIYKGNDVQIYIQQTYQ
jgi:MSHA biogenesis protein MshQ